MALQLKDIEISRTGHKPKETPYEKLMREAQEAREKERSNAYRKSAEQAKQQEAQLKAEADKKAVQDAINSRANAYRITAPDSGAYLNNNAPLNPVNAVKSTSRNDKLDPTFWAKDIIADTAYAVKDITEHKPKAFNKVPITVKEPYTAPVKPSFGDRVNRAATGITEGNFNALNIIGETAAAAAGAREPTKAEQLISQQVSALQTKINDYRSKNPRANYNTNTEFKRLIDERDRLKSEYDKSIRTVLPTSSATTEANKISASNQYALSNLGNNTRNIAEAFISIGQNASLLPLGFVNPALPLVAMGTVSAAGRMNELNQQGVSADKSFIRGAVAGAIEGLTEKLPLENLIEVVKYGGKPTLIGILKQAGMEATEEAVSYAANYIADKAAQDPNANFNVGEFLKAAQGGAISGGLMGGGATILNRATNAINRPTQQPAQADPMQQVDTIIRTNPAAIASDPVLASSVIDSADTETIMQIFRDEYGTDAMGNQTEATIARADKAAKDFMTAAQNAKSRAATPQENLQAPVEPTTAQPSIQTATQSNATQESRKNATDYIRNSNLSDDKKTAYERLVQSTKYNIQFNENLDPGIGGINRGGVIEINPNHSSGIDYLITHEIGHSGENDDMIGFALQSLQTIGYTNSKGENVPMTDAMLNNAMQYLKDVYAKQGVELDDTGAKAELAMRFYGELLKGDTKTIERLAKENPSFIQRIIEAIDDMLTRFKGTPQEKQLVDARKRFVEAVRGGTQGQTRFSMSEQIDSTGTQLTQEQADYFKNSKVRDNSGKLLKMYHGTPYGGFTQFKSESYFTNNKQYADRYQNPSASSVRGNYNTATNPQTYEVYLNIAKPFDTRKAVAKKIFQQEYYRKFGTGSPLSNRGLPDWNESRDLIDFLTEKGYDYDGLILDEGGDGGYGETVQDRGLSYVPMDANQVKRIDNQSPTASPDIRYSLGASLSELTDSTGKQLTQAQAEFFKDSKVRDESGKLLTVYHGTDAKFTVFDSTKGRANMDIQGNFFSPWEDDAKGYGGKVRPYYLNITNPASENIGYKALKKFQGQNSAGVKAREYLISLGYDGVNNGGEEYIAFNPEQIKSTDNQNPTSDPDIRYSTGNSLDELFSYSQAMEELKKDPNYVPDNSIQSKLNERQQAVNEIRTAVEDGTADNADINRLIAAERDVANAQQELALAEQKEVATEKAARERVKSDQRLFNAEQDAKDKAENKRYVQYWKDELNKAENQLNVEWQIAKEKHKGDVKLQKALDHFQEVRERDKTRRAERAERTALLDNIKAVMKTDETGYINRLMRDAFQGMDTKATSLNITGATANPDRMDMIQVNDLTIEDVQKLSGILKNIDTQIAEQKKAQGFAKQGDIYRDAAAKIKELLQPYQKVEIKPADTEIVKTAKAVANSNIEKKTVLQQVTSAADVIYRKITDTGNTVAQIGKIAQDGLLYNLYNNAKQGKQAAEYNLMLNQTNAKGEIVGDGLVKIFEPIRNKGDDYYNAFQTYMYHLHNPARMSQGKPIFNDYTTAEDSNKAIAEAEMQYPEFVSYAKKVHRFLDNLIQYRVDTGLISVEQAKAYKTEYPFYVPTFRVDKARNGSAGSKAANNSISIAKTIKTAEGSDADLMPLHESIARQTMQVIQAGKRNVFANRLLYLVMQFKEKLGIYVQEVLPTQQMLDIDGENEKLPEIKGVLTLYVNGKGVQLKLSDGLYEGLQAISSNQKSAEDNAVLQMFAVNPSNTFKKLVTGYSPMFLVRNVIRDIQDVGLYSKDLGEFIRQYPKAIKQITTNGKLWQQYQALGGFGSSIFDYQKGYDASKLNRNAAQKVLDKIESLNMMMEQLPRFTEFMATVAKGGTSYNNLMQAMFDAADVTVNFGRSGTWGKTINSTFVPFFNPAIQGTDKMIRTFTQQPSARKFAILVMRVTALGILPSVINALMYKDDEDYKNLRDSDKDVNYLLKVGDNQWIKIPKGRVLSLFGSATQRLMRTPEEGAQAWAGFIDTALNQAAPVNPFTSNIAAAAVNTRLFSPDNPGTTWYGSSIEPERLRSLPVGERYDESTDTLSKWLGGVLHLSPKKISYLLDSYSGVLGDFVLPVMTPKAEQSPVDNPVLSAIIAPAWKAFVVDGVLSNKISTTFYDTKQKLTEDGNSAKYTPLEQAQTSLAERYFNAQAKAVSDLNKQMREIENSDISDKDKRDEVKEIKAVISGIQQNALAALPKFKSAVAKQLSSTDEKQIDRAYLMANKDTFGAEYAIRTHNKDRYTKAQEAATQGISYDKYFNLFFASTPDADGNGSISQDEMRAALNKTTLTKSQKAFLFSQQNKDWKNNPYK